jgi:hypothetical protein
MEKRAIVLALLLTLPLVLYGVPYAYAATTSSTYAVVQAFSVPPSMGTFAQADCNPGDYIAGGGYIFTGGFQPDLKVEGSHAAIPDHGPNPTLWQLDVFNSSPTTTEGGFVQAICQSPITVAGIGVPEFGSLYVAIALGAVIYFVLARQHAGKRSAGITTA